MLINIYTMRIPEIELSNKNCLKQPSVNMKLLPIKTIYKYLAFFCFMAFSNNYLIGQIDFEILSEGTDICLGDSTLLSIDASVDSVQWSPTAGVSMPNSLATFVSPTQNTNYFATLFSDGMTTNVSFQINVFSAPDLGNDITVCEGDILNFDLSELTNPADYTLTSNGSFIINEPTANVFIVSTNGSAAGTFDLIANSICGQTDTIQVTILDGTPSFFTLNTEDLVVCPGDEVNLVATAQNGNPSFEWFANGVSISTSNSIVENPTTTTTYVVAASSAACAVPTLDSILVTVNNPPAIALPETVNGCENSIIELGNNIAQAGTTYSWLPTDNIIDPTVVNAELLVVEDGTYILTASNGCTIQDTIDVVLIPNSIDITEDTLFICKGDTTGIDFSTNPPKDEVIWTNIDGVPLANVGNPFTTSPLDVVSFIGTVENNGCTFSDTITIQVDSLPVFPELELIELDMMAPICEGDTVLLQDDPIFAPNLYPNLTFQWFTGEDTLNVPALPGQLDGFLTPDSLLQVLFIGSMSMQYNRLNINGACTSFSTIDVEVIPILEIEIDPLDEVCPGESFTLFPTPIDPNDPTRDIDPNDLEEWSWSTNSGSIEPTDVPEPLLTVGQDDAFISVNAMYMECPAMGMATIPVISPPPLVLPAATTICPGGTVNLNTIPVGDLNGYTFTWTSSSNTDGLAGQENSANPVVFPIVQTTYTVMLTHPECADIFQEVTIDVFDALGSLPELNFGGCEGEELPISIDDLNFDLGPGGQITWTDQTGNAPTQFETSFSIILNQDISYVITVENNCTNGPQVVGTAQVSVQQRPEIEIICDPVLDEYAEGSEITLAVNPPDPNVTYSWSSENEGDFSANPSPTTVYFATSTGQDLDRDFDNVTVIADNNGCSSTEEKGFIIVPANVMLPNIFTPGLADNSVFRIRTNGDGLVNITNLQIYDRWGNKVYDNDNVAQEWDGMIDGEPAPSDVYIYTVTYQIPGQDPITDSSDLTLLR